VVPAEEHLEVLSATVPHSLDAEGSHDFDAWMPRIAAWVVERWSEAR